MILSCTWGPTRTFEGEHEPDKCFQTNTYGTFNMVHTYMDTPFVYISTEYAFNPIGVYALTNSLEKRLSNIIRIT